jgi:IS1 family transposase
VRRELKKQAMALASVNTSWRRTVNPAEGAWDRERAGEAEMDERWSCVGNQGHSRGLGQAIDDHTGQVLADVFGRRKDAVFWPLTARLEPCGRTRDATDEWGAYTRHLNPDGHRPGQRHTQKIARMHLP